MRIIQQKSLLAITLCILVGCSKPSSETSMQDSLTTVAVVDSTTETTGISRPVEPETPIVISDSAANALDTFVNSQFEKIYLDTTNCYRVTLVDYYDEWEGQWELQQSTWYFNKEFSIVYGKHSSENGASEKPEVTEFAIKDDQVIYTKEISHTGYEEKTLTRWDAQKGGVILKWSDTFKKMESVEPVPGDYGKKTQDIWDSNLSTLKSTIENEEVTSGEDIYTILIETPKPAELVDYVQVIIPKVVYDKLKAQ